MTVKKVIHYRNALKFGFDTFIDNFFLFLKASLTYAALFIGALIAAFVIPLFIWYLIKNQAIKDTPFWARLLYGGIIGLTVSMVGSYYAANLTRVSLALYEGQSITLKDFFSIRMSLFFRFFVAVFLYGFKVLLGTFLLIIPGLYLWVKYAFTGYFILEEDASISQDMDRNSHLTYGAKWKLLWFNWFLYILEFLCSAGIITLILYPAFTLIHTHVYKQLRMYEHTGEVKSLPIQD